MLQICQKWNLSTLYSLLRTEYPVLSKRLNVPQVTQENALKLNKCKQLNIRSNLRKTLLANVGGEEMKYFTSKQILYDNEYIIIISPFICGVKRD